MLLGRPYEGVKIREKGIVLVIFKSLLQSLRKSYAASVIIPGKPPGHLLWNKGETPVAKFGQHQRFIPLGLSIAVLTEKPLRTSCQVIDKTVEIGCVVGDGVILVKIRQVGRDMEIVAAGAVILHQPAWDDLLCLVIGLLQPTAVSGLVKV